MEFTIPASFGLCYCVQMTHTHTYAKRLTGKQVLDIMFALPSDAENSDTEQDDGAYEELNELRYNDIVDSSEPNSASTSRADRRQLLAEHCDHCERHF